MGDFDGVFKTLIINRLIFVDIYPDLKTGLKGPTGITKWAQLQCNCAHFCFQVWLFRKLNDPGREDKRTFSVV